MAIVNRTPDSFFDKGASWADDAAMERIHAVIADGADIIDIGGVKAGPGEYVSPEEEARRTVPFIAAVRAAYPDIVISVETVARQVGDGPLPRLETCVGAERFAAWSGHDELTFVLLHGLLHLCGHDHMKAAERKRMEALEHAYLPALLGRAVEKSATRAARTARPRS
jgi:dihydropteroate synthase